ncbi:unnamed protein product [Adineta ricciae]|uniref:Apple domain-containing protein n=1 Tax=Adineta ricciae TaxID=249248 RepID=A0A815IGP4_ADIRI|nr:unnamed protein product [Adineta ricciae]CAF1542714.1 unnamed protein product [Adineta ricciae]
MNSSILAFALVALMVISQSSARLTRKNLVDDDLNQDSFAQKRGIPPPAKCRNFAQGKDANGGDINPNNPARVFSAVGCAALCETFVGCDHWSYNTPDSLCLLKNAPSELHDNPDWVAGACAP